MTMLDIQAPPIDGLSFRAFAGPQDYPALARIETLGYVADGVRLLTSADEMATDWEGLPNFDPYQQAVVMEIHGQPIMFGRYNWMVDAEGQLVLFTGAGSLPEWRRRGLGAAVLRWQEQRLREVALAQSQRRPGAFHAWSFSSAVGKIALLAKAGYEVFRHGFLMGRSLMEPIPELPLPDGLEIRPVLEQHMRSLFWAKNEAFRDHFGHHEATDKEFPAFMAMPYARRDLWQVAWDVARDEIAGAVIVKVFADENAAMGFHRGFTDPIFVRRPWRKRGLAKALIARSMRALLGSGLDEAWLGVDALNPNGALALYESMGYRTESKTMRWRKPLPDALGEGA